MTDYEQEQEMEIIALESILMEDMEELEDASSGGIYSSLSSRCFQITISPKDEDDDQPLDIPVQLAVIFSHTPKYPDEMPLLNVRSLKGIKSDDIEEIKTKIEKVAQENLGMPMIYNLIIFAKDWLRTKYGQNDSSFDEENDKIEDEIIVPHGLPVTEQTFLEWRERYEAELALEKAKLLPDSALVQKDIKLTGRQWFESGKNLQRGVVSASVAEDEDDEEIEYDDFDEDIDEDDILDHYLAEKSELQSA